MIEVLVGVDQISDPGAAGEPQCFFDFVDAPDVGVDEHGAAVVGFDDGKICRAFWPDDGRGGLANLADLGFHSHWDYRIDSAVASARLTRLRRGVIRVETLLLAERIHS
jgi:hypothetical protein